MEQTASDHFNSRRGNCAQAVALAWKDKKDPGSTHAEAFVSAGRGRAPEGLCGALHAARELAGEPHKDQLTTLFKEKASGYTACRDIRRNRVMPCADCVGLAAGLLDKLHRKNES
jgi:hypothetical protein